MYFIGFMVCIIFVCLSFEIYVFKKYLWFEILRERNFFCELVEVKEGKVE